MHMHKLSRWILFRVKNNILEKRCRENQTTNFVLNNIFPTPQNIPAV